MFAPLVNAFTDGFNGALCIESIFMKKDSRESTLPREKRFCVLSNLKPLLEQKEMGNSTQVTPIRAKVLCIQSSLVSLM